ncbi:MAG: AAA family ATPase [bacterium]|nr:AAA family ATPase [bacterium]
MSRAGGQFERGRDGVDERRHMTVLFSDLCGSTRLGHAIDPEVLDEILGHVKEAAFRTIADHGGTVAQFHGDGVLAVFGHPDPGEDDVRRATEAALDLHAAIRDLDVTHLTPRGFELRMHSGLDAGLVLVREGDAILGALELVGDAPNTAAGLASRAGVDEILASRTALVGHLPFFETASVAPVSLKGIDAPVEVYRVSGTTGITRRWEASQRRGLTPFIGREEALDTLGTAFAEARHGRLRRVLVVGDAGIGKTRTVEGARESGARTLSGYSEQQGSIAPLWPFQQIMREVFDLSADPKAFVEAADVEDRLEALGLAPHALELLALLSVRPTGRHGDPSARAEGGAKALAAFAALLSALAKTETIVLFLDDWQWSDDASRVAAGALQAMLANEPLLWITATRPTETSDAPHGDERRIELEPFRDEESARAIDLLAPSGLDLDTAGRLHVRSGGNPLFLEELCRSLRPRDEAGIEAGDVPATLHGLIEDRVHSLPTEQAETLRAAAVIGNVVPCWLLEGLTGLAEGAPLLSDLANADLLHPGVVGGTLRFKHGITRDVVYHSVRLADRRRYHARVAAILEGNQDGDGPDVPLESLAHHYEGAADFERASRYAERAGDRAWATAALDRTRLQYGNALDALDHLPETEENQRRWLSVSKRRAFACVFNPAREQTEMLARAAEIGTALGDLSAVGHALFWRGFIHYSLGNMSEALEAYDEGLEVAERAGDEKLVAQIRANIGESRAATCEYEAAERLLDESIEAKRRLHSANGDARNGKERSRAPTGSAYALACKGFIAAERGDTPMSEQWFGEALEAVAGTGHPVAGSCLAFQGTAQLLLGRFERALEIAKEVQAAGERMNGPFLFGRGRTEGSFARFMLEGDPEALDTLRRTTDWLEEKEIKLYISLAYGCLAEAYVRVERLDVARRFAQRALERAERLDPLGEGMALRVLARITARETPNQPDRADAYLDRALHAAVQRGSRRESALTIATQAEILAHRGERDLAGKRLAIALPELEGMGLEWYAADARRLAESLERG